MSDPQPSDRCAKCKHGRWAHYANACYGGDRQWCNSLCRTFVEATS